MDLPLLPNPVCERGQLGTGLPFTVRSASSASYSLQPCRQGEGEGEGEGLRGMSEQPGEAGDRGSRREEAPKDTDANAEDHMAAEPETDRGPLTQGRESAPAGPGSEVRAGDWGVGGGGGGVAGQVAGGRGRAEWRILDLSSRSKSVDWRGGGASADEGRRTGVLAFSGNLGGATLKRTESLERRGAWEGGERPVFSRFKAYNSSGLGCVGGETGAGLGRVALALERAAGGKSLPSRLRSQSGSGSESGSGLRDPPGGSPRPKSQSIWERIEKLYGSDKADDPARAKRNSAPIGDWPLAEGEEQGTASYRRRSAADSAYSSPVFSPPLSLGSGASSDGVVGGTFPRRLPRGRNSLDSSQRLMHAPQSDTTSPVTPPAVASPSGSPGSVLSRERVPRGERPEGQAQGKQPEVGENTRGRGVLEYSTRSLDRTRGKFTLAAQAGSARAADTHAASHTHPHTCLAEEETSAPFKGPAWSPPLGDREERWRDRRNKEVTNAEERRGATCEGSERAREGKAGSSLRKMERVQELEKEKRSDFDEVKEEKRDAEKEVTPTSASPGSRLPPGDRTDGRATADASAGDSPPARRGPSREGSLAEDVFEQSAPQRTAPPQAGVKRKIPGMLAVPSAASVRNKIHQFEALNQRAQGPAPGFCFLKPRRAFSVPEQLSRAGEGGVRKSGSDKSLGRAGERWKNDTDAGNVRGEGMRGMTGGEGVKKSFSEKALAGFTSGREEEKMKDRGGWTTRSASVDVAGVRQGRAERGGATEGGGMEQISGGQDSELGVGRYSKLKGKMEIPLNGGVRGRAVRDPPVGPTDPTGTPGPEKRSDPSSSGLLNSNNSSDGEPVAAERPTFDPPSPGSDDDKTPTNTPPRDSPFHPQEEAALAGGRRQRDGRCSSVSPHTPPAQTSAQVSDSAPGECSLVLPCPLTSSSPSGLPVPRGEDTGVNLDEWVASLNQKIEQWNRGEEDDDDDDDEGTERDEDSNYDSDESSVTITSNMSQSDRRSFCLSLADLCNFGGVDYESDAESEDWSSSGRSASMSSDVSALSCVSVLGSEELDRLLDEVKGLGDDTLQNYEDVQVVVLHKEVGVGLGFTMAGGVDQNKPVTVHKVFPSGVAAQEGSIREGDQVLSINGTALCGSAHWEALRTMRRARTLGMGVVVLRRRWAAQPCKGGAGTDAKGQKQTPPTNTGQRVCVRLEKLSRDLGFSLEGGLGSSLGDRPLSIQKIFLGGPVSQVCPGDEVLEIQGVSVVGMMRLEAWTLIRRLPPGPVEVVLHRPLRPQSTTS